MKRALLILIMVGITIGGLIPTAKAALVNDSFESSSFDGWQLNISSGRIAAQRGYHPAGTANVVSSWGQQVGLNPIRTAMDGNRFAAIGTLAHGNFTGHRTYHISLQQELSLTTGTMLSGWSSFFNGDNEAQDSAWVRILDEAGTIIATPWLEKSGCTPTRDFSSPPYRSATAWTQWFWQAPESGSYTLSFGMTTADDNNYASYGFFDGVLVSPASLPVPEPSALALVALGGVCLFQQRRANKIRRN